MECGWVVWMGLQTLFTVIPRVAHPEPVEGRGDDEQKAKNQSRTPGKRSVPGALNAVARTLPGCGLWRYPGYQPASAYEFPPLGLVTHARPPAAPLRSRGCGGWGCPASPNFPFSVRS